MDLFKFIGLFPGGVSSNDLTEMWGNEKWKAHKLSLIRASLLVFKPNDKLLTLLPFMNTRAYELLEEEQNQNEGMMTKKTVYHLK